MYIFVDMYLVLLYLSFFCRKYIWTWFIGDEVSRNKHERNRILMINVEIDHGECIFSLFEVVKKLFGISVLQNSISQSMKIFFFENSIFRT